MQDEEVKVEVQPENAQYPAKETPTEGLQPMDARREQKHLKNNNYEKLAPTLPYKYVIINNRKGIVAEICAASPLHACTLLGWRMRHCGVLETKLNKEVTPIEIPTIPAPIDIVEKIG